MGEHSASDDAKNTNPNFDDSSIEWGYNCQRCVVAYEMRRRGYDVTAKPMPTKTINTVFFRNKKLPDGDDHLYHKPFDVWIPPESVSCVGRTDVEKKMQEWGDGSRCEIMVLWKDGHGMGHVFVAEQIKGVTHFIDPQTGKDGVGYYFDLCEESNIYICRTDNKGVSDYIGDCCY